MEDILNGLDAIFGDKEADTSDVFGEDQAQSGEGDELDLEMGPRVEPVKKRKAKHGPKSKTPPKTLKMSSAARRRLDEIHDETGRARADIMRIVINQADFIFQKGELGGHNSKGKFNIVLSDRDFGRIRTAARNYRVGLSAIVSALVLREGVDG